MNKNYNRILMMLNVYNAVQMFKNKIENIEI